MLYLLVYYYVVSTIITLIELCMLQVVTVISMITQLVDSLEMPSYMR